MKNYKKSIIGIALAIGVMFTFCACDKNNEDINSSKQKNLQSDNIKNENNTKEEKENKDKVTEDGIVSNQYGMDQTIIAFNKVGLESNFKPTFNTKEKISPKGEFKVCIDGKGPEAIEEGIGNIIINNLKDKKKYKFEIKNNKNQLSPLNVEWINDNCLLVVIGKGYGTVARGGNLYSLNLKTGTVKLVYKVASNLQQVSSVEKLDNNKLKLNIVKYDDETMNNYKNITKEIELK